MTYQVLARKWRPRGFEEMIGQTHVIRALVNALDADRLHHAYLFTGTRGVGKTTIARILAKCLNCEGGISSSPCGACSACREIDEGRFVDLIEVDAASRTKVDETRELLENVPYAPTRGRFKVYLIDEVHMFSGHSFNALLKTLEEPPPHVKFLLATTDPQRLPVTILSRCLQFNLKRLPLDLLSRQLAKITLQEGVEAGDISHLLLAQAADGSVRDALSLLDQAIAFGNGKLLEQDVREMLGTIDTGRVFSLLQAVADRDGVAVMQEVADLAEHAPDFDEVLSEVASLLQRVAVAQVVPEVVDDTAGEQEQILALAGRLSPEDAQLYYQIAVLGRRDLPLAPNPTAGFEMAMLRMLAFRPGASVSAVDEPNPGTNVAIAGSSSAKEKVSGNAVPPILTAENPEREGGKEPDWADVVGSLGVTGLAREMAVNSVMVEKEGNRIRLRLSPGHGHLHGKAREAQLQKALSGYYKESVRVVVEVGQQKEETPAMRQQRESEQRHQAAVNIIEADPKVQELRDRFDAEIVRDSVRPVGG